MSRTPAILGRKDFSEAGSSINLCRIGAIAATLAALLFTRNLGSEGGVNL